MQWRDNCCACIVTKLWSNLDEIWCGRWCVEADSFFFFMYMSNIWIYIMSHVQLAILFGKNLNVERYKHAQTVQLIFSIPAMLVGTIVGVMVFTHILSRNLIYCWDLLVWWSSHSSYLGIWFTVETCWCDNLHTHFISSIEYSRERSLHMWFCSDIVFRHLPTSFFQTSYGVRDH